MKIDVIKRDGSYEPYSEEKIKKVVIAAGLYPYQAQILVTNITKWIEMKNITQLTSLQIRDQVIVELKKLDDYAANLYIWYQGTKEKQPKPPKLEIK